MIRNIYLLVVVASAFIAGTACAGEDLRGFHIVIGVSFETEELNIQGLEGGTIFEPAGYGRIDIRVGFPIDGGEAVFQTTTVQILRYEGKGPNCTLRVPADMSKQKHQPIVFRRIFWNKQRNTIHISREVRYPEYQIPVKVTCPPKPEVTVPDYPLYKILGAFIQNRASGFQGYVIPLESGKWSTHIVKNQVFGQYQVFRADLEFSIRRTMPGEE